MCVTLRQSIHNDVYQINYNRISNGFNDTERRGWFDISLKMHIKTPNTFSHQKRTDVVHRVLSYKNI